MRSFTLRTIVIQAVFLQKINDVEFVTSILLSFLNSEIIPLCVAICIHVSPQYQLVFVFTSEKKLTSNTY